MKRLSHHHLTSKPDSGPQLSEYGKTIIAIPLFYKPPLSLLTRHLEKLWKFGLSSKQYYALYQEKKKTWLQDNSLKI